MFDPGQDKRSLLVRISKKEQGSIMPTETLIAGENDKTGMLVHKPGGAEPGRWIFDYDVMSDDDDEAGFLFGRHAFVPGVSILDAAGITHTFLVRSVTSL
jgi:hypothetical protein